LDISTSNALYDSASGTALPEILCECQVWTPTATAKSAEIKEERKTNYQSTQNLVKSGPKICVAIQNGQDMKCSISEEFFIPCFGDNDKKLRYSMWQELSHHREKWCTQSSTIVQAYKRTKN
jgi:hypothetical protein